MKAEDEAILGYLVHLAAEDLGSTGRVAKGAAMHAFITTRPFHPDEAKRRSDATKQRVRDLLAKRESVGKEQTP